MQNGSRLWAWAVGGALLLSAAGLAIYFAKTPAQAGADQSLPMKVPATAAQTSTKRDNIFPDPEAVPVEQDKRMGRYDKNKNQLVERVEFLAARQKAFEKLDSNADGKLSFDEYALKTAQKFDASDANHNGTLERPEFAATARPPAKKKCECQGADDKDEK
jgi:EF hand